jgi:hypothetical protein
MKAKILSLALIASIILTLARPGLVKASALDFCNPPGFGGPFVFEVNRAVALTSNGESIEMDGNGVFDPYAFYGYYVGIEGTFKYKDPTGVTISQGTWASTGGLLKYKNYGCSEGYGYWPGGRAAFRIVLTASDGSVFNGTLDTESPNGDAPAGAVDGIRLSVKAWGLSFDQPVNRQSNVIFSIF